MAEKSPEAAEQHFQLVCREICVTAKDKPGDMLSALCMALELVKADRILRDTEKERD